MQGAKATVVVLGKNLAIPGLERLRSEHFPKATAFETTRTITRFHLVCSSGRKTASRRFF